MKSPYNYYILIKILKICTEISKFNHYIVPDELFSKIVSSYLIGKN
jgi:hypothetical protein